MTWQATSPHRCAIIQTGFPWDFCLGSPLDQCAKRRHVTACVACPLDGNACISWRLIKNLSIIYRPTCVLPHHAACRQPDGNLAIESPPRSCDISPHCGMPPADHLWTTRLTPYQGIATHFKISKSAGMWSSHDDVIKWKHFLRYWPFVRGIHMSPVNSPHKGLWRGAFMVFFICAWINSWVNNRDAGDLRRHRAHYDVTVIRTPLNCSDLIKW